MKLFYYKNKINFNFFKLFTFFLVTIFPIFLNSCDSTISLQIVRPPIQKIDQIEFIEIGNFEFVMGNIDSEIFFEPSSSISLNENKKLLKPAITNFISKKTQPTPIVDLIRSILVHELSIHSPYKFF